jgi:hypothetical protein
MSKIHLFLLRYCTVSLALEVGPLRAVFSLFGHDAPLSLTKWFGAAIHLPFFEVSAVYGRFWFHDELPAGFHGVLRFGSSGVAIEPYYTKLDDKPAKRKHALRVKWRANTVALYPDYEKQHERLR